MKPKDFRKELLKIMPGYKWTVHKSLRAGTLARALRSLQKHYESMASMYANHTSDLQAGREQKVMEE